MRYLSVAQLCAMFQASPAVIRQAIKDSGVAAVEMNFVQHISEADYNLVAARVLPLSSHAFDLAHRANSLQ